MNSDRFILKYLVVILLVVAGCSGPDESTPAGSPGLTFIHLNDTYRVDDVEDGTRGGFGRVVTIIRQLQDEGRDVRVLHAGDFLYPSLESQLWNGQQMIDALNFIDAIAPVYLVIGNHELDRRTPEHLANAVRASTFDWLGDNYEFTSDDREFDAALQSGFTIEYDGRAIGIFALLLHADVGGSARDYTHIDKDFIGAARAAIGQLEAAGVDAIIGLTHLHMWQDVEIAALKSDHPTLAFIVGGHDHEPQYSPGSIDSAPVMKGASNARVIWRIDLAFDDEGNAVVAGEMLDMDTSVAVDPGYQELADKWRGRLLEKFPLLEARVGMAAIRMNATEDYVRNNEAAWANFIVDQMLTAFGEPAADLAFINSGSLRLDDHVAGEIRFEDIGRTFAFSSFLRRLTVTGAEFRELMEAGFRGDGTGQGFFPQVAGFRVCFDRSRPTGSRIASLQVPIEAGWQEIDAGSDYVLVVPDFIFQGGDGYQVPQDRPVSRSASELEDLVIDAILRAQGEGRAVGTRVSVVAPRIVEQEPDTPECFAQ